MGRDDSMGRYAQVEQLVIACRSCEASWTGLGCVALAWGHAVESGHPLTSYWQQTLERLDG